MSSAGQPVGRSTAAGLDVLVRGRRMRRAFASTPVDDAVVVELLDLARRAPSAGNTQSVSFLTLTDAAIDRYWETTLGPRRATFRWPGLLAAPVLVVPYVCPTDYVRRYGESDKAGTGLGDAVDAWSVPYWWVDGGAAVQNLLLAVEARGLGACFFGQFDHEAGVRQAFGVPDDHRALGTVAIGHPAPDRPGRSSERRRPPIDDIVHRQRW